MITEQQLKQLLSNSQVIAINHNLLEKPPKKVKKVEKFSKYKSHIHQVLSDYCNANGYILLTEHRFHDARKWRFDWAIAEIKIAVEYEGIIGKKSRHTTVIGFTGDAEKYNAAQMLGWDVFRFSSLNYLEIENLLK
jgi:hypothetical protein